MHARGVYASLDNGVMLCLGVGGDIRAGVAG